MSAPTGTLPLPELMTIPALLLDRASRRGDHPALRVGSVCLTYHELAHRAAAMAGSLAHRGIGPGDRVAAMSGNRIELIDLLLGCSWLGAVAVPLNTALRGASLADVLTQSGARHLLVEPEFHSRAVQADFRGTMWLLGSGTAPQPDSAPASNPTNKVTAADTAAVLFTSGTTSVPKGVRCPHAQFLWWGRGVGDSLGLDRDDVLYNGLPLFHTNALNALFQALVAGGTFVLGQHFSVSGYWQEVTKANATVVYLLGAMVAMLAVQPPSSADRAHRVTRALSPATPARLCAPFRDRFGIELIDGYGTTESNLVLGTLPGQRRPGYLGFIMDGYDALVVDPEGEPVADGTPGELLIRTERNGAFALGYLGQPPLDLGSWLSTGDRVVREADDWFRFVDRIKDVIRRRGENISSNEVEEVLAQHPDVGQVAVFPVPSELAEDEVMASVVPRNGCNVEPHALRCFAASRLAYFALPRYIDIVETLPLTETGKVRKFDLRTQGTGPQTWDAEASEDLTCRSR